MTVRKALVAGVVGLGVLTAAGCGASTSNNDIFGPYNTGP